MSGRAVFLLLLLGAVRGLGQPADEATTPEAATEPSPEATLAVQVEPTAVSIGDRLEATLTLETAVPPAEPPRFPLWQQHWGDAEILAVDEPVEERAGVWRQRLTLTVFETGLATLPAVEVEVPTPDLGRTIASEPTIVNVRSVLPESEEQVALQPPEPVRELPLGRRFWWATAALGLACALLGFLLLRSAHRVHRALATLALSPIDALVRALGRLRDETDLERQFTSMSLELRRYLGRAIGFPAAEGTTTEIQRQLRSEQLPPELVRETLALLREADQVKFARVAIEPGHAARRLDEAEQIARGVEEWLEPASEEETLPEVAA